MNIRIKLLISLCIFVSIIWTGYLFVLQIFNPIDITETERIRYDEHKEFILANRGNIYDQKGLLLVSSMQYYQLDIDLFGVRQAANDHHQSAEDYLLLVAQIIGENTDLTSKEVYNKLTKTKTRSVLISEKIDYQQLFKIRNRMEEENINACVFTYSSTKRIFTKGLLAARLIGLTKGKIDSQNAYTRNTFRLEGINGIEKTFEKDLEGDYGWRRIFYDAKRRKIANPNSIFKPVIHGSSIYLTIDSEIQEILEKNLQAGLVKYKAENGIGVIMDPMTGNIIAMAGVNENDIHCSENQVRGFQNMPVKFKFEPGSTIKPLVSLLAIEKNIHQENDLLDCRPMIVQYKNAQRRIRDAHDFQTLSFKNVIVQSSNVGIAKIAQEIGEQDLYRQYINFGIGTTTGIDLIDESSGQFAKRSDWSDYTLHSISFGQEMQITAIQLTNIYAAFANGGQLLKPNIIEKKVDAQGKVYYKAEKKVIKKLSNPESIALNNSFLLDVVESGTGKNTKFNSIKIAGKTGTAEKAVAGKLSKTSYIASFAGFFPFEKPEYVMVIIYDAPDYMYRFGSMSAAPTFRNIVEEILTMPDCKIITEYKMKDIDYTITPQLIGLNIQDANRILDEKGIRYSNYHDKANSFVLHQIPQPGVKISLNTQVSLYCGDLLDIERTRIVTNESIMPNLVGLSIREAIHIAKMHKLNLSIVGNGHVASQSIEEGKKIGYQQECLVVAR